jgi:hypothetical protein
LGYFMCASCISCGKDLFGLLVDFDCNFVIVSSPMLGPDMKILDFFSMQHTEDSFMRLTSIV